MYIWLKPLIREHVLQMDGLVREDNFGCGCTLRDIVSTNKYTFQSKKGNPYVLEQEFRSISQGLQA